MNKSSASVAHPNQVTDNPDKPKGDWGKLCWQFKGKPVQVRYVLADQIVEHVGICLHIYTPAMHAVIDTGTKILFVRHPLDIQMLKMDPQ